MFKYPKLKPSSGYLNFQVLSIHYLAGYHGAFAIVKKIILSATFIYSNSCIEVLK